MKLNIGGASACKILKDYVIDAFLYDANGRPVTIKVYPGMPIATFRDDFNKIANQNVDIEVDTSGFVFCPIWEKWGGIHSGIYLHRVRFSKKPSR